MLTGHTLGLAVLLFTIVPAYLTARPHTLQAAREAARQVLGADGSAGTATDDFTSVEIVAHIKEVAARYGVAPLLVAAIVEAESEFNPRAVSRRGARGLMQLMPRTASSLQVDDTFDPYENIEGGVRHLRRLMDRFNGNLPLALAAYNAGEQAVRLSGGIPPYPETRRYVIRILRRIGRGDLATGVSTGAGRAAVLVRMSRAGSGLRFAVESPARVDEREPLERQEPTGIDRDSTAAPRPDRSGSQSP